MVDQAAVQPTRPKQLGRAVKGHHVYLIPTLDPTDESVRELERHVGAVASVSFVLTQRQCT